MVIEINDVTKIGEIQEAFSNRFPYLKIEFFKHEHAFEEQSNETPYDKDQAIGSIREHHVHGIIMLNSERKTGAVEQEFKQRFDLNAQIYRLQAGKWIQTVGTDILSINEQNEIAKDSASYYNPNHTPK